MCVYIGRLKKGMDCICIVALPFSSFFTFECKLRKKLWIPWIITYKYSIGLWKISETIWIKFIKCDRKIVHVRYGWFSHLHCFYYFDWILCINLKTNMFKMNLYVGYTWYSFTFSFSFSYFKSKFKWRERENNLYVHMEEKVNFKHLFFDIIDKYVNKKICSSRIIILIRETKLQSFIMT